MWGWRPRVTVRRRRLRLVASARAVSLPAPRVRRGRPSALSAMALNLDRPLAFRALFRNPGGAPFLAEATPERELLTLLAAPSLEEAASAANGLAERSWAYAGQEPVFGRLRALALGEVPIAALWGEDRAADALRLRLLRAAAGEPDAELPEMRWGRFLRWAGERLAQAAPPANPALIRVEAASLAAAGGYRFAFDALTKEESPKGGAERFDVLSLLSLRCALEDVFVPRLVEWLVPSGELRRAGVLPRDPWANALAALRAFGEQGHVPALAHLTAALVAADLRERALTFLGREAASVARRRWWSRVPPQAEGAFGDAVAMVRSKAQTLARGGRRPWPKGWGGPEVAGVLGTLERLVGGKATALELFLDDRLAVAGVYAAIGYVPSALAQVDATQVTPALSEARQALRQALARGGVVGTPALLTFEEWERDADRMFRQLRATPDPSVELGSPHWLLEGSRGALMTQLVKDGRRSAATAVRTVLERADLQQELGPFWILRGTGEDTQAVRRLALWAAQAGGPPIEERHWMRFIEAVCRAQAAESTEP